METNAERELLSIFPELLYVADRSVNPNWRLNDTLDVHNIMLVYGGSAEFSRGDEKVSASKGDLIYYKALESRKASTNEKSPLKCFAVDFAYICPIFTGGAWINRSPELPFKFYQRVSDDYLFGKLKNLFIQLTRSVLSPMERSKSYERSLFAEILTLLIQSSEESGYSYSNVRKVQAAINYMLERFSENITLGQLASHVQLSESYLGKVFKMVTGKSPIDYLIDIRINKAKALLHEGLSVTETSRRAGFNDIYYFSRTFKNLEGISPSAYADRMLHWRSENAI